MTTRALVLGGGGLAGIGWEMGVLAGLAEAGVDLREADLIIGTSAGANVAAQVCSGLPWEDLLARQSDPALLAKELTVQPDFQKMIADLTRIVKEGGSSRKILQGIGALAMATPTVSEEVRRKVIAARLPVHEWPACRLEITAVDIPSGTRAVFGCESDADLIDAVAASSAVPCIWPPVTIGSSRYIDGGCYSFANADLAVGFDKVLVLQPDVPPFPLVQTLDEQVELLRREGSVVEVITPNDAMKAALAASGGNPLDPATRAIGAAVGREQGGQEAQRIKAFWG